MWLATKYGVQKVAPMRMRQDQLGLDGAIRYRELFEAHPELERGPDEEIQHHFDRLKSAEKSQPKLAAIAPKSRKSKVPALDIRVNALGSMEDAINYGRLIDKHPNIELGPDEDMLHHHTRLKAADKIWQEGLNPDRDRRSRDPNVNFNKPRAKQKSDANWVLGPQIPRSIADRNPGWYTSPESESAGFGVPPMVQRIPGDELRPSHMPTYAPEPQSHGDWIKWLTDKGIVLDDSGQVPGAARPSTEPPPRRGHDIWQDFIGPTTDESAARYLRDLPEGPRAFGKPWHQMLKERFTGRRASAEVVNYIDGTLEAIDLGEER